MTLNRRKLTNHINDLNRTNEKHPFQQKVTTSTSATAT